LLQQISIISGIILLFNFKTEFQNSNLLLQITEKFVELLQILISQILFSCLPI